jgi:glutamine synthetase
MLMAGLDGIERGLDPGAPSDFDLFEESRGDIAQVPGSLGETLDALEADHAFLTRGGVFSEELIRTWIAWKRQNEVDVVRLRPNPGEFFLNNHALSSQAPAWGAGRDLRPPDRPAGAPHAVALPA